MMTEPAGHERDQAVLRAFVEAWDQFAGQPVPVQALVSRTGLDWSTVQAGLSSLLAAEPVLIGGHEEGAGDAGEILFVHDPTDEARRRALDDGTA